MKFTSVNFSLNVHAHVFQNYLLKSLCSLHGSAFACLSKTSPYLRGSTLDRLFPPLIYVSIQLPYCTLLITISFIIIIWNQKMKALALFFFKAVLVIQEPLYLPIYMLESTCLYEQKILLRPVSWPYSWICSSKSVFCTSWIPRPPFPLGFVRP